MIKPRCITISVDYSDVLAMTLPYNKHFVESTLVVTSMDDHKTVEVALANGAQVHQTDEFFRRGCSLNKWSALEEGLGVLGRSGWILILDADIAIPEHHHEFIPQEGFLYCPHRRIKEDLKTGIPEQRKWAQYKRCRVNEEHSGYFQMFHGSDPLLGKPPWFCRNWKWVAGADMTFVEKWPVTKRVRPPFEVLHLGEPYTNWSGRASMYADGTYDAKRREREEKRDEYLRSRQAEGPLSRFRKERINDDTTRTAGSVSYDERKLQ